MGLIRVFGSCGEQLVQRPAPITPGLVRNAKDIVAEQLHGRRPITHVDSQALFDEVAHGTGGDVVTPPQAGQNLSKECLLRAKLKAHERELCERELTIQHVE
mmetsp:Transcript_4902/g.11457  ORF Transcript_4902/g.11457 Transcript_4902/m.11457 type:complete len:102 (-) Transcript_4902:99-404(-)